MNAILIVEDSESLATLFKSRAEAALKMKVVLAATLAEAEQLLKTDKDRFLMAVLDLNLPDAPGGEIVDLALSQGVPSVVLTGVIENEIRDQILKKGVLDYFLKDNAGVIDSVIHAIDRFRKNRAINLLVVDDSKSARAALAHFLGRFGFKIRTAEDGSEALKSIAKKPVQLVITDFQMPGMDGLKLVKKLRTRFSRNETAVIGFSSYGDKDLPVQFIKAGANDFLVKPYQPEELLCRVYQNIEIIERYRDMERQAEWRRAILGNALDAIITMDMHGRTLDYNPAAEELFGWSPKEILGQPLADFIIPESHREHHKKALAKWRKGENASPGLKRRFDMPGMRKDGMVIDLQIALTAVSREGKTHFTAFIQDITDRKQLLQSLNDTLSEAESANKAKSEFIANMSHEIRTPMNAVLGFTDLALKTDLPARARDYLDNIENASRSLMGIINDILDFSKVQAGRLELDPVKFDLSHLFDRLSDLFSKQAADKAIELIFLVPTHFDQVLIGDVMRLEQVLINLIRNAIKFTENGAITITALPEIIDGGRVHIDFSVKDTGIGIDPERLPQLFAPFVQADGSTTRKFGGTGLGLTICKKLVDLMGGRIRAESVPGEGSAFSFDVQVQIHSDNRRKPPVLPPALHGQKALLAEDNPDARARMLELLEAVGLAPAAVATGAEALDELTRTNAGEAPYAFLFLDWSLPGKNGAVLTAEILATLGAASPPALFPKIFLLTPFGLDEARQKGAQAGAAGFLDKPVTRPRLVRTIAEESGEAPDKVERRSGQVLAQGMETGVKVGGARVLLAEDNEINQQIAREFLEQVGLVVEIAADGKEAVRMVESFPFDAVLMDIQMPKWDGIKATKRIRRHDGLAKLPIIAMTAHALPEEIKKFHAAGMNDYLSKPLRPERLYGLLSKWIGNLRPLPSHYAAPTEENLLPDIPGLDAAAGLERVAGNHALYHQLLARFGNDYNGLIEAIAQSIKEKKFPKAASQAHAVRGVAGNLGALPLSEAAGALEAALGRDDKGARKAAFSTFTKRMNELLRGMGSLLPPTAPLTLEAEIDGDLKELVDLERITPLIEILAAHLASNGIDVEGLMARLEEILKPTPALHLFREMAVQVRDYNFEEALEVLCRIARPLEIDLPGPEALAERSGRKKVLIVDDQRSNVDVLKEILTDYNRAVALDGRQALVVAQSPHPPDLILLDIMMPEMNGYEVCKKLQADPRTRGIPVIFVTAKQEAMDETEGFRLGGVDFITKPFNGEIIQRRVAAHLELKSHRDLLEQEVRERTVELEEAKREAERGKEAAEAGNHAKSRFLATMSHEIRTPLNAILGMGELLLETEIDDEQRHFLTTSQRAGDSLLAIITSILDLSKIEAEKMELERVPFDLIPLIRQTLEISQSAAEKKELNLSVKISPELPQRVMGDPNRLHQVLLNLLSNAIKFTLEGEVSLTAEPAEEGEDQIRFSVADTGIGIDLDQLENIFKPFIQADPSTTRQFGGTGLGLTICQSLVDAMGGGVRVESAIGSGSVFHVTLPLPEAGVKETDIRRRNAANLEAMNSSGLTVLLVEDAPENQLIVSGYLEKSPHRTLIAENGVEALEILQKEPVDMVLMDMLMPVMDGYEATQRIREWERELRRPPLPIIALTAQALQEDLERALDAGCNAYLTKPISKAPLLEKIQNFHPPPRETG